MAGSYSNVSLPTFANILLILLSKLYFRTLFLLDGATHKKVYLLPVQQFFKKWKFQSLLTLNAKRIMEDGDLISMIQLFVLVYQKVVKIPVKATPAGLEFG